MKRTLLIDADILAYQSSAAHEKRIDWGEGVVSCVADFDKAKATAKETLDGFMEHLKADDLIICLSDDFKNFRNLIYPDYKQNRKGAQRPEHLYDVKDWLRETYPTVSRPTLEADDVMGILATEPHEGQRIIVSADKDMKTVPGWLYRPQVQMANKPPVILDIQPEDAEWFMLYQALTGDATDGYSGCPGVGPMAAEVILDSRLGWVPYVHTFKSGPRKGQEEARWLQQPFERRWDAIVSAFTRAGLTEDDAIVQVNLARILKHDDLAGTRIIPWVPSMLEK